MQIGDGVNALFFKSERVMGMSTVMDAWPSRGICSWPKPFGWPV